MKAAAVARPGEYFAHQRHDLLSKLPRPLGRVLDVGCGEGASHAYLRQAGATEIVGIELEPAAATRAATRYDRVLVGDAADRFSDLEPTFDTILCHDVLEHLVDPSAALVRLRGLASSRAHLQVSIPNARHVSLLVDLVGRGTFGYTETGHRDIGHLRWFTRKDFLAALPPAGWKPVAVTPSAERRVEAWPVSPPASLLQRASEFFTYQWYFLAVGRDDA